MTTKKNTMAYDKTVDYQSLINQAAAKGDYSAAAKYEQQRNEKISGENLGYSQTSEYAAYLPKSYDGVEYDLATDYMSKINQAMRNGDYSAAAKYEQQRNAKIDGEGLPNAKTNYTYTPQYDTQINELFNKLLNRESFSYDTETDPLYKLYREQYINQGRLAMQDTMGQAAALTGGYGSSYSQAVGQQQYDAYLQKLNGVVPELYQLAYSRYQDEGDELKDQYNMYMAKDAQDYDRARINYAQLQSQMNAAADQVKAILEVGGSPSADLVLRSGLSDEYVQTLKNYYAQLAAQAAQTAARSGGSSDGGGGSSRTYPSDKDYKVNKDGSVSVKKVRQLSYQPDEGVFEWNGNQYTSVDSLLDAWEKKSDLTNDDINILKRKLYSQMGRG
jgi:hypothetical protein